VRLVIEFRAVGLSLVAALTLAHAAAAATIAVNAGAASLCASRRGTDAGEWLNYTVSVAAAGTYAIDVRAASNGAGGTFHIEVTA
jgi:hypothetical protein